jgi:hypothetical protein
MLPYDFYHITSCLQAFYRDESSLVNRADFDDAILSLNVTAMHIARAGMHVEVGAVLFWPFLLPESVLTDMKELNPYAMILLSYYAVLVDVSFWFFCKKQSLCFTILLIVSKASIGLWTGWNGRESISLHE